MADLLDHGAVELASRIARREVRAVEVVEASLAAISSARETRAFLSVAAEAALASAMAADARADARRGGPLNGVPVAVKDLCETVDQPTSYGLFSHRDHRPSADCVMVERLRAAGAVIIGKTNTPALGTLGETKNRLGADCVHPLDARLSPGGSSGGSAVAVAARLVPMASGTDSAGSVTAPAAFCGVYGIRPSHGRIPNWPVGPSSGLLNDLGVLSREVRDSALFLQVCAGPDPRDPVCRTDAAPDFVGAVASSVDRDSPLSDLRIAYSADLGHFAVDAEVLDATLAATGVLTALGARVEADEPAIPDPFEIYMPLSAADTRLAVRDMGAAEELFPEMVEELDSWPDIRASDYAVILSHLWELRATVASFFTRYDLMVMPATAVAAFPLRELPVIIGGRPVLPSWATAAPFSALWNMTGQPTASVPCGATADGRPVGLLIVGRPGGEAEVLRASAAFELASGR